MLEKKIKVLNLTNRIPHYNLPAYNLLAKRVELTVAHWGSLVSEDETDFEQIPLTFCSWKSLIFFKENILKLANNFDVVLVIGDLHVLPFWLLGFNPLRKYALTFWGIGVSASYDKKFDDDRSMDRLRFFIMNKADSLVFYSQYPIKRYVVDGNICKKKMFVANNTVEIKQRIVILEQKEYFLFVGTLYKEKKIFDLLGAYLIAVTENIETHDLVIVGDGDEKKNIECWISEHGLNSKIKLLGAIYDSEMLMDVFRKALVCISPGQAGLSVLTSMAYGVPFVTTEDAITGGEIFNIQNGVNGILYKDSIIKLAEILKFVENNPAKIREMGIEAQDFYFTNCKIEHMVDGLYNSINYAYEKHNTR